MNESPIMPPPSEVLSCIEEWRSLDLRKESRDVIQREFNRIFFNIVQWASTKESKRVTNYYRVREHEKTWDNTSELWAPPSSLARKNRCNFEGEPMLYVSPNGKTCLEELGLEIGKQLYIIKYQKRHGFSVVLRRLWGTIMEPRNLQGNLIHSGTELVSYQILREFIRAEFMKPACKKCDGTSFIYDFTASICDFMTMHQDDLDGFIYPSVVTQSAENIAFFPEQAREKLEVVDVRIVKLIPEDEWFADPRVDSAAWRPILRGKTHFLYGCFKGEVDNDNETISWKPCPDLGAF